MMFADELADLKNRYPSRLHLLHTFSAEDPQFGLPGGRLAFLVGDVNSELDRLAHLSVPMRDHVARPGAGGMQIAFLEPHALSGVLGELVMPLR